MSIGALGRLADVLRGTRDQTAFGRVTEMYRGLPYMNERRARIMREIIVENDASDILELGFFHGKSSAYIGAILEDRGRGHLTTIDKAAARNRSPSITEILEKLSLSHRVTPIFADSSFTWELSRQLSESPQYDLVYIDGGHTWDTTGFAFLLVDFLLRPGGVVVFDDMDWTIAKSPVRGKTKSRPEAERNAKQVRMVFDLLVRRKGYVDMKEIEGVRWGFARKPKEPV